MLDNRGMEIGYAILVIVSFVWSISQVRYAVRVGDDWRWLTSYWLLSKTVFFAVAASAWWFDRVPELLLQLALYNLAFAHVLTFIRWLRLPDDPSPLPPPVKEA